MDNNNKKIRLDNSDSLNESNQSITSPSLNSNGLLFPSLNNNNNNINPLNLSLPRPPPHPIDLLPPPIFPFSFPPPIPFGLQWPPPPPLPLPPFIPTSSSSIPFGRILPPPLPLPLSLPIFNRIPITIENNNVIRPQTTINNTTTTTINVIKSNQKCNNIIGSKSYGPRDDEKRNNSHNHHHQRSSNSNKFDTGRTRSNHSNKHRYNNNDDNGNDNDNNDDDDDDVKYMNRNKIQKIMEEIYSKKILYKRSTPLEPYYRQKPLIRMDNNNDDEMIVQTIEGTQQLIDLHEKFKQEILLRSERLRSEKPSFSFPKRKIKLKAHKHHHGKLIFFILVKFQIFCSNPFFSHR